MTRTLILACWRSGQIDPSEIVQLCRDVPAPVAQAIHDYLVTRPMREVEGLVNALRERRPQDDPAFAEYARAKG